MLKLPVFVANPNVQSEANPIIKSELTADEIPKFLLLIRGTRCA
jgi:hypothetical protein